jgi:DNA-binding MarR family transcriptional regulator
VSTSKLTQPESLDDLFLYRLTRLFSTGGAPVIRLCEGRHGITRREWRLIAALALHGPMQSSELALRIHLERGRTSKGVMDLAEKKLVSRTVRPNDRRLVDVALTEAGRAVYDALFPEVAGVNRELLSALSAQEVGQLDALLGRLQVRADELMGSADLPKADRRRGRR